MSLSNRYAEQLSQFGHSVVPSPLQGMRVALFNSVLAHELGLPQPLCEPSTILKWLHSPVTPITQKAFAQKYGGHQFGYWNPELGDGRGLLLAEVENPQGVKNDLHLKGAGPTPYSRHADGRAVLRSTLREYIAGEALHHLGVPSSRSLCLFGSTDTVFRERPESGAMMIRTAPSHLRFGHFEYYFHTAQSGKLQALLDYTIDNHFPECRAARTPYESLLHAIVMRTARLIALWQAHGFVHGVMNTDNMSIHGITFDYGPYAFLDHYDPSAVFNHSDHEGRYAFNQQPAMALWNLNALAHAFSGHCSVDTIKTLLSAFEPTFLSQYQHLMLSRMGLDTATDNHEKAMDIMQRWLDILASEKQDYTYSFRQLALADIHSRECPFRDSMIDRSLIDIWWREYCALRQSAPQSPATTTELLLLNPAVIPRSHLLQEAINHAEKGDFSYSEYLLEATCSPYDRRWDNHEFSQPPKSSTQVSLSCSS